MAVCLNHTDTPAATRCAACGKPICEKCIVAGSYCSFECQEKADLAAGRTHQMMEGKARTDKKNRTVKTIIILILLAAAAAGAYYYMQNPKKANKHLNELSGSFKKAGKAVEKRVDEAKERTNKRLNQDSRYKKNAENLVK
ncbi:MAG: hypothetical protein IKC08_01290 [Lentisphaeria bacterium]|nr:hypothetical protein [Lentisphaeria bacterium]